MVKDRYTPLAKKTGKGEWCARRLKSPKMFDPRFGFRTVRPKGRTDIMFTIGCPRGKYHPKTKRCDGTATQRILKLKVRGRCPRSH